MSQANARPVRTNEDLKNGAEYIAYEVSTLSQILKVWPFLELFHPIFKNMALESFLLHFRNVRDFLFPAKAIKEPDPKNTHRFQQALDNVIGFDFNPTSWDCDSSDWTETVAGERDRINKQLSHVSYSRSRYEKGWPLLAMADALMQKFTQFLKTLPKEKQELFQSLRPFLPDAFN